MRILGLDVGSKTIGIAVSDELGLTAQGVSILERKGIRRDSEALRKLVEERGVEKIVVGLPKNMNNTLGPSARMVLSFITALKKVVSIPIVTWDERLSTVAAQRVLREADMSRRKRKRVVDKVAALLILQGYLDSRVRLRECSVQQ